MKKCIVAVAVACCLMAGAASAESGKGWFVGAQLGDANSGFGRGAATSVKTRDTGAAWGFNVGHRWALGSRLALGPEFAYQRFGSANITWGNGPTAGKASVSTAAFTLGGNMRFSVTDRWYLSARGGWLSWSGNSDLSVQGQRARRNGRGTGLYAGVGAGLDVTKTWSVGMSLDKHWMSSTRKSRNDGFRMRTLQLTTEWRF
ncbi:outer membrane protein assembly factor BamA [Luteibacter sp. Sphag1AF]|uniref:outer membrane beta-barrel protein n=1 Tax=Luteibacter sp. Sphag1AF TaxID=2587031 RepID=UPI001615C23B|nr:outer membrane beta-barrel protein [Luteibacter sp. Sphag1AF]MBB3225781.1 outer membrane protein assembly factor BamA [Luteibacter sp. Sphag1AF]